MLTRTDNQGNWCLNGVEFAEIRAGCTLSRKAADTIYAAICKLKDYEDTGLDPDEADRLNDENDELKDTILDLRLEIDELRGGQT